MNLFRTGEPAPMGIADYGMGPSGPYQYSTNESEGRVDILSLYTQNATGGSYMSFQLNENLVFTTNGITRVYWIQDVAQIDTATGYVWFLDNVWNSSSWTATMSASGISGNGHVATIPSGRDYYFDLANQYGILLPLPVSFTFLVSSQANSFGQPTVTFEYDAGSGLQSYDTVTFEVHGSTSLSGFEVNGFNYTPFGNFYDSELVMGGVCCRANVTDAASDVRLILYYNNSRNLETVPNASNFGSDTAEGMSNAKALSYYFTGTGTMISEVFPVPGSLGELYDQSQTGTFDIRTSIESGTLYVSNATDTSATPAQYQFTGGEVTVSVYPGKYLLQIYQNGVLYDQGTFALSPGQTLELQTPLSEIQVKMSYQVQGEGAGFSLTLAYTHGGVQTTSPLTATPTTYYMDPGTGWTVSGNLTSGTQRWATLQPVSGTATSFQTLQFTFYHQYLVNFSYAVRGGGSGYSAPTSQYTQFGAAKSATSGAPVWVDDGSSYSMSNPLIGSTSSETWDASQATGTVGSSGTIETTYYHQFALAASYSVVGGGLPAPPRLNGTEFGMPISTVFGLQPAATWLDSGTIWNASNSLQGASPQERWASGSTTSGVISGASAVSITYYHQYESTLSYSVAGGGNPASPSLVGSQLGRSVSLVLSEKPAAYFLDSGSNWTLPGQLAGNLSTERWITTGSIRGTFSGGSVLQATYDHQFYLRLIAGPSQGGSVVNSTGWYGSGTAVQLSASANTGWRFEGWSGSGDGAYTGPLNRSSVQTNGPVVENATFYPGLQIAAGPDGDVSYSYGTQSGEVLAGTSATVFAPLGTVISLSANPSSLFYEFETWAPASVGTSGQTTVTLASPTSIRASFSLNLVTIGAIAGVAIVAVLASILAVKRRSAQPAH